MRNVALKPLRGYSQVKELQHMHVDRNLIELAYFICKVFVRPLLKPLNCRLLTDINVWHLRAFINDTKL